MARRHINVRALHLVRAGSGDAARALLEAALKAEASFDDLLASDLLHAAVALCAKLSDQAARHALEIEIALASSRVMRTTQSSDQAILLLEELQRRTAGTDVQPRVLAALGKQLRRRARLDEAASALKRALAPTMARGDRAAILELYLDLGKVFVARSDFDGAIRELSEGLDLATLGEGPRAELDVRLWPYLLEIAEVHRAAGRQAEARRWCENALWQAEHRGDRLGLLRCHNQMAWVLRDLKQAALAEQHLGRAIEEARHFGDRLTTTELLIERARGRAARGRLAEAHRCCEEALRLARGLQWSTGIEHAERAIALLRRPMPKAGPSESER